MRRFMSGIIITTVRGGVVAVGVGGTVRGGRMVVEGNG